MNPALRRQAWARWQAVAGPWQGWSICPVLVTPEAAAVPRTRAHRDRRAELLADAIRPWLSQGGTLCVLDLEPTLGVQVAAGVADAAHPVLVLPRWPYAHAVLPTDRLLATLLAEARTLPEARPHPNVAFVLDGHRSQLVRGRRAGDPRADNRTAPVSFDLPDVKTLRAREIRRIHYLRHT